MCTRCHLHIRPRQTNKETGEEISIFKKIWSVFTARAQEYVTEKIDSLFALGQFRKAKINISLAYKSGEIADEIKEVPLLPEANEEEVLSLIKVPHDYEVELEHYCLHPTIMDSALHSVAAIFFSNGTYDYAVQPKLPFSVERVEILHSIKKPLMS